MLNALRTARGLTGAVFVLFGLLIGGAYALAYGYFFVQTVLPGPLFHILFQQSLLSQGLPFLAVGVVLIGVLGAFMVLVGYPFLLKWVIRLGVTLKDWDDDTGDSSLFILLDSCMELNRVSPGAGLALLTELAGLLAAGNDHIAQAYFDKLHINEIQPSEEKYLLWRAWRRGGIAYLYALWPVLSAAVTREYTGLSASHVPVDYKIDLITAFVDLNALSDALGNGNNAKRTLSDIRESLLTAWLPVVMHDDESPPPPSNLVKALLIRPMLLLRIAKSAVMHDRVKQCLKSLNRLPIRDVTNGMDQVSALFFEMCQQYRSSGGVSGVMSGKAAQYSFIRRARDLFPPADWLKLISFCPDYARGTNVLLQVLVEDMEAKDEEKEVAVPPPSWFEWGASIPGFFTQFTQSLEQHLRAGRPRVSPQAWTQLSELIFGAAMRQDDSQIKIRTEALLFDPNLYLSLLKTTFFDRQRQSCLIKLIQCFLKISEKNVIARARVITPEFLASLPAYMGVSSNTLKSCLTAILSFEKDVPLALHLITQPGFFRTTLDAYQTAERDAYTDHEELLEFIFRVLDLASDHLEPSWKGRLSRDLACFSSRFYMEVLMHDTLRYKEKYTLVFQLQYMRNMYYEYQDTLEPEEDVKQGESIDELQRPEPDQRMQSVAWLVTAPEYLNAWDYTGLQEELNADEKGIFTRNPGDLRRFFSAMCAGARFFKEEGAVLKRRFRLCEGVFLDAATKNKEKDKAWDGVDPALYTAIAESPFHLEQKGVLLSTLLLGSLTYLANSERKASPVLNESFFTEKLPPQLSAKLLQDIRSELDNKNNAALTEALSKKIADWQSTVNACLIETPDTRTDAPTPLSPRVRSVGV